MQGKGHAKQESNNTAIKQNANCQRYLSQDMSHQVLEEVSTQLGPWNGHGHCSSGGGTHQAHSLWWCCVVVVCDCAMVVAGQEVLLHEVWWAGKVRMQGQCWQAGRRGTNRSPGELF